MVIQTDKENVPDNEVPNYLDNIHTRPYSMTSSVFDTFCESQLSNNSHYLPDLTHLESVNETFFAKNCDDKVHTQELETNSSLYNSSIDLNCIEVMPIEESPESTNFGCNNKIEKLPNYPTQDLNTLCDYDSDDSVRDKDYNPSESDTSSDDSIGEGKRKKFPELHKNKKSALERSPLVYHNTVSDIENSKILHKLRRSSFDIRQTVQPIQKLARKRRNTIDFGVFQILTADDTSHNLEQESSSQRKRKQYNTSALQRKIDAKKQKKFRTLSPTRV